MTKFDYRWFGRAEADILFSTMLVYIYFDVYSPPLVGEKCHLVGDK